MVLCHKDDEKEVDLRERWGAPSFLIWEERSLQPVLLTLHGASAETMSRARCHGNSRIGCFKETLTGLDKAHISGDYAVSVK